MKLESSYLQLPEHFYSKLNPRTPSKPEVIKINEPLASELGIDVNQLDLGLLSGASLPQETTPFAQVYAGHQFGGFVPQLGDGRALILGEVLTKSGDRFDIQLKGSGITPYSRQGDGLCPLGPAIREYVVSEGMYALGVPTTRSLAVVRTGDSVMRHKSLPGAVLTRVAASHIRVGTFEFFAARHDVEGLRALADYAMKRHYPEAESYLEFLQRVLEQQATTVAKWMCLGFVHGVMNTDNMTISGETIDYGPCAFIDDYQANKFFSSIDRDGRYAFSNQGPVAQWNLSRFAETLLPLIDDSEQKAIDKATEALENFPAIFKQKLISGLGRKLGFFESTEPEISLIQGFLNLLEKHQADYTFTFRSLCKCLRDPSAIELFFSDDPSFERWFGKWVSLVNSQDISVENLSAQMRAENPSVIPRNHLVEAAIKSAVEESDYQPFRDLVNILQNPFIDPSKELYTLPPTSPAKSYQTFCGT